jgi:hypothetical protein
MVDKNIHQLSSRIIKQVWVFGDSSAGIPRSSELESFYWLLDVDRGIIEL